MYLPPCVRVGMYPDGLPRQQDRTGSLRTSRHARTARASKVVVHGGAGVGSERGVIDAGCEQEFGSHVTTHIQRRHDVC